MKTIGIVGSRRRAGPLDYESLLLALDDVYEAGDRLVSGGCQRGGDAFAGQIARERGLTIIIHYADWSSGTRAGLDRNSTIAADCDVLIALVAADRTGGTEDTIRKAEALGKKVVIV